MFPIIVNYVPLYAKNAKRNWNWRNNILFVTFLTLVAFQLGGGLDPLTKPMDQEHTNVDQRLNIRVYSAVIKLVIVQYHNDQKVTICWQLLLQYFKADNLSVHSGERQHFISTEVKRKLSTSSEDLVLQTAPKTMLYVDVNTTDMDSQSLVYAHDDAKDQNVI